VQFCNTLVDRIVPGSPSAEDGEALAASLGYRDGLLTTAEHFRQFVIEGDDTLRGRLGFAGTDRNIIIAPDIEPYRQRKVRLLNGAHTISVAVALLAGCTTVRDAMVHARVGPFIRRTLLDDIVPTLDVPDAEAFARSVLDRFENPYIRHALFDITLHGTTKFRVRVVPTILRAAERLGRVPESLALGFAAQLLLARGDLQEARRTAGLPVPVDELAERIRTLWPGLADRAQAESMRAFVQKVSRDEVLWGADLGALPHFVDTVTRHLTRLMTVGADEALDSLLTATVA
jgi:tagaturonate reductase